MELAPYLHIEYVLEFDFDHCASRESALTMIYQAHLADHCPSRSQQWNKGVKTEDTESSASLVCLFVFLLL